MGYHAAWLVLHYGEQLLNRLEGVTNRNALLPDVEEELRLRGKLPIGTLNDAGDIRRTAVVLANSSVEQLKEWFGLIC